MRASVINRFGNQDVFEMADIAKPQIDKNQILIKVFAHSINPIDWKQREGNHKLILGSPFPIVLGYDVCGEVLEVGSGVKKFKPGNMLFGVLDNKYGGALAEFAKGHENCFAHKPENINIKQASAFPMVSLTALQALRDTVKLKSGQSLIINGASGGVGHMAVQVAKLIGARVIAVASSKSKDFVSTFNPDRFVDYTKENILNLDEKADVFMDIAGNYNLPKIKHLLKNNGIYLNLEYIKTIKTMPFYWFYKFFSKGKRVKTLLMKHNSSDLELIARWISEGKLSVAIDKEFTLDEISKAHEYAQMGHNKGKNIVVISN